MNRRQYRRIFYLAALSVKHQEPFASYIEQSINLLSSMDACACQVHMRPVGI